MKLSSYHILLFIKSPKIHTDLLWDLTALFLGLAVLYFLAIFFFKNKANRLFQTRKTKRTELAPIISNFLFHSSNDPKEAQKEYVELKISIREYLADKRFRKILADILFDLQKDVAGATRERLFKLFVQLGLHHDSYKKLSSWRWDMVSQGILELAQMEVAHAFQYVAKYINDRRGIVRKQAELAVIHLKEDGIQYLLNNTRYTISEWQQLKLIEALETRPNFKPPKFKAWLIAENKDVVLFSLRLIKYYNQNDAGASIIALVNHKDDDIKIAAIHCIQHFNFLEATAPLKKIFWNCADGVKIHLLDTLGDIGTDTDLGFLYKIAQTETNFSIANRANRAINTIQPGAILPTKGILEDIAFLANDIEVMPEGSLEMDDAPDRQKLEEPPVAPLQELEIEEKEIYDLVEVPIKVKVAEEPVLETEPAASEDSDQLEIQELEEDLEKSLNFSLGLLNGGPDIDTDQDSQASVYGTLSQGERETLLDNMMDKGAEKETPLLEFMMENEADPELRFKAFNTLKHLAPSNEETPQGSNQEEKTVEEIPAEDIAEIEVGALSPERSVFYELYEHTSDWNARQILIHETVAIGDEKEMAFLNYVLGTGKHEVMGHAKKAMDQLTQRLTTQDNVPPAENDTIPVFEAMEIELAPTSANQSELEEVVEHNDLGVEDTADQTVGEADDRIPLELCFIYDELGILYTDDDTKEDLGLNFELSQEYMYNLKEQG